MLTWHKIVLFFFSARPFLHWLSKVVRRGVRESDRPQRQGAVVSAELSLGMVLLAVTDIFFFRVELSLPGFTVLQVSSRPAELSLGGIQSMLSLADLHMQRVGLGNSSRTCPSSAGRQWSALFWVFL